MERSERLLYLDLDGVLNGHERLSNGYCGICPVNVGVFNSLLEEFPDLKFGYFNPPMERIQGNYEEDFAHA